MTDRTATVERETAETTINLTLNLDGDGTGRIDTGIGFLDHMLESLARHGRLDLELNCDGDLHVDDHHTVEDCGIAIGTALDRALGDRSGIERFGSAHAPLDEALARSVVDLSGRPHPDVDLGLTRDHIGELSAENTSHLIESLARNANAAIHVDVLKGDNDHHRAEAAYKSLALALREAVTQTASDDVPSTKDTLTE